MEMKTTVVAPISRRLVKRHDIREGHLPEIIEFHQDLSEDISKVAHFPIRKCCEIRLSSLWCDEDLVSITSEVGQEPNRRFVFRNDAATVLLLGVKNILK